MKANPWRSGCYPLGVILGFSVLLAGCASMPWAKSPRPYQLSDVEGVWTWAQEPWWHGDFVLKAEGDSCTGIMNDAVEGTYGDKLTDVTVADNRIKFTRKGKYGIQYWEGTLKRQHGVWKIVDGRWTNESGYSGLFRAEKKK